MRDESTPFYPCNVGCVAFSDINLDGVIATKDDLNTPENEVEITQENQHALGVPLWYEPGGAVVRHRSATE